MLMAIKIYSGIAKGLRKPFHTQAKLIMPFILPKLKDAKSVVVEETRSTLNNFLYCISPDDCLDTVKEGLNDKLPQYKI